MFERMEIKELIYKGVVEPSYKKPTWVDSNHADQIKNKIGDAASYKTHPATVESSGKRRKRYVDSSKIESKTCLIHGPGHYSDECKVLGDFGTNYSNSKPTKYHGNHHIPREKLRGS